MEVRECDMRAYGTGGRGIFGAGQFFLGARFVIGQVFAFHCRELVRISVCRQTPARLIGSRLRRPVLGKADSSPVSRPARSRRNKKAAVPESTTAL